MANIGYGITFGIYNGSSYTNVAEVTGAVPPQYTRDAVETTHMTSANQYREYIGGMMDGGEVTLTINYTPSTSDVIITALQASTLGSFRITFASGVMVTFSAVVTAYNPEPPLDDRMVATATFKVSGRPVWA